jgi:hypothetical protein
LVLLIVNFGKFTAKKSLILGQCRGSLIHVLAGQSHHEFPIDYTVVRNDNCEEVRERHGTSTRKVDRRLV